MNVSLLQGDDYLKDLTVVSGSEVSESILVTAATALGRAKVETSSKCHSLSVGQWECPIYC